MRVYGAAGCRGPPSLGRKDDPEREVQQDLRTWEQARGDEEHAHDGRRGAEPVRECGAHAADHPSPGPDESMGASHANSVETVTSPAARGVRCAVARAVGAPTAFRSRSGRPARGRRGITMPVRGERRNADLPDDSSVLTRRCAPRRVPRVMGMTAPFGSRDVRFRVYDARRLWRRLPSIAAAATPALPALRNSESEGGVTLSLLAVRRERAAGMGGRCSIACPRQFSCASQLQRGVASLPHRHRLLGLSLGAALRRLSNPLVDARGCQIFRVRTLGECNSYSGGVNG